MEGERIGPYRVVRRLGSGGMGEVFLAEVVEAEGRSRPGDVVALKVIHPHLHGDPRHLERFLREAEIGRAVQHENVGRFLGHGTYPVRGEERHVLVMEYVEGQTLRALIEEMGRVPERLCVHIAVEVARALGASHAAGVVHRDLKPENVMITPDHHVKVVDFGVARLVDATMRLSQTGTFLGSVEYAAPEQFGGRDLDVDGRADLHALGILLFEMSTGKHPFRGDDPRRVLHAVLNKTPPRVGELDGQLSPFFEEVVATLLAKDRDARFADTRELLDVLDQGEHGVWWRRRSQARREAHHEPERRVRVPRETDIYGREHELAQLETLFDEVARGEGRTLLVEGETGIGKTRLVDEFVRRLRDEGQELNFLFGAYLPGGAATISGALAAAYREHFGEENLEAALHEVLPATPLLVPAFAAVLRGEPAPAGAERLTSQTLSTLFVRTTQALAHQRPTVILLEDLHFAPEEGRDIFTALAQATVLDRTLLIGTFRPQVPVEWVGQVERMPQARRIVLSRLGARDLVQLLADAFRSEDLAEELSGRIAVKSDGNPFFVFEIVRALRDERMIRKAADGSWVLTDALHDVYVPSTVTDLVQARLGELEREDRELLELASCCGFEFDPIVVTSAAGAERLPTLKRFGHVERKHRLVHSLGARMVFDHHQVHDALYQGLMEPLREEYHRALAEAYAAAEANGGVRHPVEIAEHFVAARDVAKAGPWVDDALAALDGSFLHERALALGRAVLDADGLVRGKERFRLLEGMVRRLDSRGLRDEQGRRVAELKSLAEASGDKGLLATACREEGFFLFTQARYPGALAAFEAARRLSRETGDLDGEGQAVSMIGAVAQQTGRHDVMARCYQEWLETSEANDDASGIAAATAGLGNVCLLRGRYEEAAVLFERSRELAVEVGSVRAEGVATGNLSTAMRYLGRHAEALEHVRRRLELARAAGDRRSEGIALLNLAGVLTALGDFPDARRHYERAERVLREIGARREEGTLLHGLGTLAYEEGRLDRAEAILAEALDRRRELDDPVGAATVRVTLGRLLAEEGRREEAEACLGEALAEGERLDLADVRALVPCLRAALLGADAAPALKAWQSLKGRLLVADRLEAAYRLWQATGEAGYLAEARRLLDYLVDHAPTAYRASFLEVRPLHRELREAQA